MSSSRIRRRMAATFLALLVVVASSACARTDREAAPGSPFPTGSAVDYQLGGAYPPGDGIGIVARDSLEQPAPGVWSICYVNGFQTQPGEGERWSGATADLLLRTADGGAVMDPGWPDEALLDTSSAEKRARIAGELSNDITRCADRGFAAVEIDNLDSYTRSSGRLNAVGAAELAAAYATLAHARGLLIGQKNSPDQAERMRRDVGFDFVVTEECVEYDECGAYADVYGDAVIDIEYTTPGELAADRERICATPDRPRSLVIRDRELSPDDAPGYVRATC